jgi:hypothetical protein
VAGEAAISAAIRLPVQHSRRSAAICSTTAPTCAPFSHRRRTRRQPGSRAGQDRRRAEQVPLDPTPSSAHSYDCSSGPPWNSEASQLQLPRSGPDGQPVESSHLGHDGHTHSRALLRRLGPTRGAGRGQGIREEGYAVILARSRCGRMSNWRDDWNAPLLTDRFKRRF